MMMDLQKQAERFETKVHYEMITKVEFSKEVGGVHKLYAGNKEIFAKTVIISTGATAKYLGLDDEKNIMEEEFLLVQHVTDFSTEEKMLW
jgi:thioredoxin reductase (NADPH)